MLLQDEEMRYVEGGATYKKRFKLGKTVINTWEVKITDIKAAGASILYASSGFCAAVSGILSAVGSAGTSAVASYAISVAGVSAIGYNASQLKKHVKIKKISSKLA